MEEDSSPEDADASVRQLLQLGQRELSAPHEEAASSESSVQQLGEEGGHQQAGEDTSFSVRIFPQLDFFPADLFEEICLPGIIHVLGSSDDGAGYTWPQRGWQNRQELEGEVQAALALADVGTVGIVIARVQSRQQAEGLVQRMAELQINAAAENVANPPLSALWITPAETPSSHRSRAPASQSRRPQRQNSAETERAVQELMRTTLYEGNKAPVAKATVRSSLPTFVVGTQRSDPVLPDWWPKSEGKLNLHDKDDCLFCMEAFQAGETVSFLPCGHCYHLGAEGAEGAGAGGDDNSGSCKGICHWLESSNVCPICRFPVPVDETSAPPPDGGEWVCPLCNVSNAIGGDCSCGCLYTSQLLAAEGSMSSYFRGVEGLFASMLGAPRPLSEQQRTIFSAQVQAMTDHPVVQAAEEGGWEIRVAINNLLTDVLEGANGGEIVVKSGGADRNSLGVIGVLVRRLSAIQTSSAPPVPPPSTGASVAAAQPAAPPVPPAAPRISFSSEEYAFDPENFQSTIFPRISDNVRGFLRQNNRVFSRTARLIVKGGSGVEWEALTTNIFPSMERSNWKVSVAVGMMRGGVRDYGVLTSGLVNGDVGSRVCIEVLLEMIRGYERSANALSQSGPASGSSTDFKRQPSVGTLARQHLDSLRSRLSPESFLRVLGTLTTVVKNVRQDPSSEKFRKLKKSNRTLSECVLAHAEAVSILEGIGFVEVGGAEGHLHLVHIKELDLIVRTLKVLNDYRAAM